MLNAQLAPPPRIRLQRHLPPAWRALRSMLVQPVAPSSHVLARLWNSIEIAN